MPFHGERVQTFALHGVCFCSVSWWRRIFALHDEEEKEQEEAGEKGRCCNIIMIIEDG